MMSFAAFEGEEHRAFKLEGGQPAALLIHGFPGTPAEMRPLGDALHEAGWTVQGLLLPGFGADIETLPERKHSDWIDAACDALRDLQREHHPVVMIGFSMGGAVALCAAARVTPDALVLLNPFSRMSHVAWKLLPFVKRIFPRVRPFSLIKLDFDNPETRESITRFLPGADLDDPDVQEAIRGFSLPTSMFDQLRQLGERAFRVARTTQIQTLIVQASRDETVAPATTRKLAARLPKAEYTEVDGEHNFTIPEQSAWKSVLSLVLEFMHRVNATFH
ncbi:MAG: alpha/beta fold hydrolase [Anaerolineae bacterium]|nr:alpha/beta fold hydrolase [Anaerolineae bacterium]